MVKEKISSGGFAILMFIVILATAVLFLPSFPVQQAKQAAWLSMMIIPPATGILTLLIITKLSEYYSGQTLAQYSEAILGKLLGKAVALAYAGFFLFLNVLVIREFAEFISLNFLLGTPVSVLCALIVIVGGYSAGKGIEVICRMSQFILPLFLIPFFLVSFTIFSIKISRLLPIFDNGIGPVVHGSIVPATWLGEIIVAALLIPFVNQTHKIRKKGVITLIIIGLMLTIITLFTILVFGPDLPSYQIFPFKMIFTTISIANFIQRVEVLVMAIWVIAIVVKVALFYFVVCLTFAQALGLKSYKTMLYPMALTQIVGAVLIATNALELLNILNNLWPPVALTFEIGLPTLLLSIAFLRNRKKKVKV